MPDGSTGSMFNMTPAQVGLLQAGLSMMSNSRGPNSRNAIPAGLMAGISGYLGAKGPYDEKMAAMGLLADKYGSLSQPTFSVNDPFAGEMQMGLLNPYSNQYINPYSGAIR